MHAGMQYARRSAFSTTMADRQSTDLDCNAPLPFHLQFVQILLLAALLDSPCELQQAICQSGLAMVHMGYNGEVSDL